MAAGLLSFPITDFDAAGDFCAETYTRRLEWLMPYGATVLFAAGGTGEFFSLTAADYRAVVSTAVKTCHPRVPIIAGAGGPTRQAMAFAQEVLPVPGEPVNNIFWTSPSLNLFITASGKIS